VADGATFAMTGAPLLAELAEGPPDGAAFWITAADGPRLRVAVWGRDAPRGTVLVFPGRTEAIEKYGRAAADLCVRGFASAVIDWRGQGLSDRLHGDPALGHVGRFADYQKDVAAMLTHVRALGLPRPFFLLAHSMGGAIGLRALLGGLDVRAAAFSSPMWRIAIAPHMRPVAWTLSSAARPLGLGHVMAPGQPPASYILRATFEQNTLTSDPEMWDYMRRQIRAEPRLGLGGPSLAWLNEALRENRRTLAEASPSVPALAFAAGDETIVVAEAIRTRMARWPRGRLVDLPGARHEVLMETPDRRQMVFDTVAAHFIDHS
jgi:lysophospholipase